MTVKEAQWLSFKIVMGAIVAFIFCRLFEGKPVFWLLMAVGFALLITGVYIEFKYMKCPECARYLARLPFDAENCPYCGARLE